MIYSKIQIELRKKMMSQNVRQIVHQYSTSVPDSPSVIKPIGV
jgi:hypothetical protein